MTALRGHMKGVSELATGLTSTVEAVVHQVQNLVDEAPTIQLRLRMNDDEMNVVDLNLSLLAETTNQPQGLVHALAGKGRADRMGKMSQTYKAVSIKI